MVSHSNLKPKDLGPEQDFDALCESIIIRFERRSQQTTLDEVQEWVRELPRAKRDALLSEIARISLEKSFPDLGPDARSPFVEFFDETFSSERWREEVAFEHYRLARQSGQRVERSEIARQYGLNKVSWTELPVPSEDLDQCSHPHNNNVPFPRPGDVFCGYPLLAKLGRGAIARVYLAKQMDLAERLIVLKVTDRLTTEADKLARIQHSNIVPVYSIHKSDQLYAICMPFLGSLTVADLIAHRGKGDLVGVDKEQFISTVVSNRLSTIVFPKYTNQQEGNVQGVQGQLVRRNSHSEPDFKSSETGNLGDAFNLLGFGELSKSLSSFIGNQSNVEMAVRIISGVVNGMAYSHEHGISHCDLKPENVLIANDGRPVILDFNLANRLADGKPNLVGGTLPYMSPQQLRAIETSGAGGPDDDVFAIGVIFYQLLTGSLPFPVKDASTNDLNRLASEREIPPIALRKICNDVSPSLQAIVQKCLSPNSKVRYPSASELHVDLQCYREDRVLRFAPDVSPWERTQKFFRRNPSLGSSTTLLVLAATLLTVLVLTSVWNSDRLSKLNATAMANELSSQTSPVLAKLHAPSRDEQILVDGISEGRRLLSAWKIDTDGVAKASPLRQLSGRDAEKSNKQLGYLLYAMASAEANLTTMGLDRDSVHLHESLQWNQVAKKLEPSLSAAAAFQRSRIEGLRLNDNQKEAVDIPPTDQSSMLGQMLIAREKMDIREWNRLADSLVAESPSDPTSWFNLGAALFSAGKFDRAFGCFDTAAKLQPESLQSVFWRGLCRMQLNEMSEATEDFSHCLKDHTNWIAARFNRAVTFQRTKKYQEALLDLNELIERNVGIGTRVWVLRSNIRLALGQRELSLSDRQTASTVKPIDAEDWTSLGLLQLSSNPNESLRSFERSLAIDPSNFSAMQNSVHVLSERLDRTSDAMELLATMGELRPKDASIVATRGILAARCGDTAVAVADANRAELLNPGPVEKLQIAGIHAILSEGTSDSAEHLKLSLQWLNRALLSDPKLASVAASDSDLKNIVNEKSFRNAIESALRLVAPQP